MNDTTSKERPILFSAPMVRAIIAGQKTQTRRLLKGSTEHKGPYNPAYIECHKNEKGWASICPYGSPGDRLWVRETWWHYKSSELELAGYEGGGTRCLLDDGRVHEEPIKVIDGKIWEPKDYDIWQRKPSIHMPRWASRITLEITGVRVERLQDISTEDIDAEGFGGDFPHNVMPELFPSNEPEAYAGMSMQECFARLWSSIHAVDGPNGWSSNPWVWVVEFKRVSM